MGLHIKPQTIYVLLPGEWNRRIKLSGYQIFIRVRNLEYSDKLNEGEDRILRDIKLRQPILYRKKALVVPQLASKCIKASSTNRRQQGSNLQQCE